VAQLAELWTEPQCGLFEVIPDSVWPGFAWTIHLAAKRQGKQSRRSLAKPGIFAIDGFSRE
jgi:hypothetical protein